jgi:hypothetical protein
MEHIAVTKDGEIKEKIDVAELAIDVSSFKTHYISLEDRLSYKIKLLKTRKARELRVLVDLCPRFDGCYCWFFHRGEPCTNPSGGAHEKRVEDIEEDTSDEFEEEMPIVGPEFRV